MSRSVHRVQLASAYVLHQRPFRDSSLIVEIFAREYGRMTVFARAARGPRPRFGALQPFRALLLSWSGRGEAPQLTAAEADTPDEQGGPPAAHLMSAFYLNELLLTLTTRHDPHPELFDQYRLTLAHLRRSRPAEAALRRFEARLLDLIGYGLNLAAEADTGRPVRADAHYHYRPGVHGVVLAAAGSEDAIPGRVLQGLVAAAELYGETDLRQARALMRRAIDHCLEGRPLRTRIVARSLSSYPRKERRA
ncbi:MAG TPA: DNA repair protein RecO [Steroidobacteraceae bacterium]